MYFARYLFMLGPYCLRPSLEFSPLWNRGRVWLSCVSVLWHCYRNYFDQRCGELNIIALLMIFFWMPETKQRSPEELGYVVRTYIGYLHEPHSTLGGSPWEAVRTWLRVSSPLKVLSYGIKCYLIFHKYLSSNRSTI